MYARLFFHTSKFYHQLLVTVIMCIVQGHEGEPGPQGNRGRKGDKVTKHLVYMEQNGLTRESFSSLVPELIFILTNIVSV